jgi:hypothetical protein
MIRYVYTLQNCFFFLETDVTLANLHEEMKVLNEALAVEQANVQEVRKHIDEFKGRIAAQNQEISRRIAGKEQREAQVCFYCILFYSSFEFKCVLYFIHKGE